MAVSVLRVLGVLAPQVPAMQTKGRLQAPAPQQGLPVIPQGDELHPHKKAVDSATAATKRPRSGSTWVSLLGGIGHRTDGRPQRQAADPESCLSTLCQIVFGPVIATSCYDQPHV